MSVTAIAAPKRTVEASSAADAALREHDGVEYPERHWIAQSVWHGDAVRQATDALRNHFRDREDVLVAMELAVYYKRGDDTVWLQPDVQVVFGVGRGGNRSSLRVWEERKGPDFVLEVASPSTAEKDARDKSLKYASIGVREYWRLDPEGSLMGTALEGYALYRGKYGPLEVVKRPGGGKYLRSRVLGLDLRTQRRDGATVVVFADPLTGEEFDGAIEEASRGRQIAEQRASAAANRVAAAERRAAVAEGRATVAEGRAASAEDRAAAAEERATIAEESLRALEERLRSLSSGTRPRGRDS
ncbi:MAG: Uma2 family endonuclease [Bryobacterales bacterium]|nr:Uma2 family endonuclease [Bryobacterales bacterium]